MKTIQISHFEFLSICRFLKNVIMWYIQLNCTNQKIPNVTTNGAYGYIALTRRNVYNPLWSGNKSCHALTENDSINSPPVNCWIIATSLLRKEVASWNCQFQLKTATGFMNFCKHHVISVSLLVCKKLSLDLHMYVKLSIFLWWKICTYVVH